jgi:hypothetical protein
MALTKQDLKEIRMFQNNLKNSGMNPWGNLKRGKDMKIPTMGRPKKAIYNKEDAVEQPQEEKFKNKK